MSFSHDRRGQSVVIGTVILFGFLILALSLYQVQFVPAENSEIEFEHSQEVEGDFLDLRNTLLTAGTTGEARSTSIRLGLRYPQRTFFLNPPPVSGEVSTTDRNDLVLEGTTVVDEGNVADYWENRSDGEGNITFETRSVRYSPNYNEFQDGPDLIYEHSLAAAEFDNTVLSRTGQTVVRGDEDRISLTMIDGDLSESGVEQRSFDPETLSQQRRTVTLEPDNGTVTIVLPTAVEGETKRNDLAEEWEGEIGDPNVTTSVDGETIRVEVETEDPIQLALSQVGLGSDTSEPDESDGYITNVSDRDGVAVAEVRDRFNNPVEDANVTVEVDGSVVGVERTDGDGRVEYTATDPPEDVEFQINDNDDDWERVRFSDLGRTAGSGSGGGESDVGQSGESQWSPDDSTATISDKGGIWSGIDNVNSIVLSEQRLTPISPGDGEVNSDTRYFRFALTVGDPPEGDRRFTFVVPTDSDGIAYEYNSDTGRFEPDDGYEVTVYDEQAGSEAVTRTATISQDTLQLLVNGGEVDLLQSSNYEDPDQSFVETLNDTRNYLESNTDQEAYISDIAGRVDLTLENRTGGQASSVEYNNDGTTIRSGDSGIEFSVSNTGDESVNIDSVVVESTTSPDATVLRDGTGSGQQVITVSGANEGSYQVGNDGYSFGEVADLSSGVSVTSGSDATISLTRFYDGGSGNSGNYVDMSGEDVTVTLQFSDGTQKTFVVST